MDVSSTGDRILSHLLNLAGPSPPFLPVSVPMANISAVGTAVGYFSMIPLTPPYSLAMANFRRLLGDRIPSLSIPLKLPIYAIWTTSTPPCGEYLSSGNGSR